MHTIDNIHLKLPEEVTGIPSVIIRIKDFGDNTIKLTYDKQMSSASDPKVSSSDRFGNLKLHVEKNVINIDEPIKIVDTKTLDDLADNRAADDTAIAPAKPVSQLLTIRSAATKSRVHNQ